MQHEAVFTDRFRQYLLDVILHDLNEPEVSPACYFKYDTG